MQKKLINFLKNAWNIFLDFVLPQPEDIALLEKMSAEEFVKSADTARQDNLSKNVFACFDYRNPTVRLAVWELKYRGNKKIASLLANALYGEMLADISDLAVFSNFKEPLIIPIPISKKRRRERGFNQCELLVEEICKLDGEKTFKPNFEILKKAKDTGSQTKTRNRQERLDNLSNCFQADSEKIRGRNIILIDDVITTGATAEEARKTLLSSGARKVAVFAVAH
jgi:competence protein ComFC